jgi:hypothetical protein
VGKPERLGLRDQAEVLVALAAGEAVDPKLLEQLDPDVGDLALLAEQAEDKHAALLRGLETLEARDPARAAQIRGALIQAEGDRATAALAMETVPSVAAAPAAGAPAGGGAAPSDARPNHPRAPPGRGAGRPRPAPANQMHVAWSTQRTVPSIQFQNAPSGQEGEPDEDRELRVPAGDDRGPGRDHRLADAGTRRG